MIYRLILTLRDRHYRRGAKAAQAPVPTVCIGNITVGGTGKTPHSELTLRRLEALGRGPLALLSRGYARKSSGYQEVTPGSTAAEVGDEPLQVSLKFPGATVAVCKDRLQACQTLAQKAKVIVLDDAFQYRRLKASLNVVLTTYDRPVTTDRLLPAGRLRDLPGRMYDADAVIVSKCPTDLTEEEKAAHAALLGFSNYSNRSAEARGRRIPLLFTTLKYGAPAPVFPEADRHYTYSPLAVLFTGVADDKPLYDYLSGSFRILVHRRFPDHYRYGRATLASLERDSRRNFTSIFLTTEKDACRLRSTPVPERLRERLFYIPVRAEFLSEEEAQDYDKLLINI